MLQISTWFRFVPCPWLPGTFQANLIRHKPNTDHLAPHDVFGTNELHNQHRCELLD